MPMVREEAVIIQTYNDYVRVWQTLNPQAVLPCYHTPFMLLRTGRVITTATPADHEAFWTQRMQDLEARGYARDELEHLSVKQLGDGIALLSVMVVRYKTDGEVPERFGVTYTLLKADDGWKIARRLKA